jgi:hypothetical protein
MPKQQTYGITKSKKSAVSKQLGFGLPRSPTGTASFLSMIGLEHTRPRSHTLGPLTGSLHIFVEGQLDLGFIIKPRVARTSTAQTLTMRSVPCELKIASFKANTVNTCISNAWDFVHILMLSVSILARETSASLLLLQRHLSRSKLELSMCRQMASLLLGSSVSKGEGKMTRGEVTRL